MGERVFVWGVIGVSVRGEVCKSLMVRVLTVRGWVKMTHPRTPNTLNINQLHNNFSPSFPSPTSSSNLLTAKKFLFFMFFHKQQEKFFFFLYTDYQLSHTFADIRKHRNKLTQT